VESETTRYAPRMKPADLALGALILAAALPAAPLAAEAVTLPGISYQVLASGRPAGAHPTRADSVQMRYVGRLADGAADGPVFSTSPGDGRQASTFAVNQVIPGMSAALQLMRVGDRWKIRMPPYLAYGPGRPFTPPPAQPAGQPTSGAAAQVTQKRGIPANATLIFDVELLAILPPKAP
jgi:FKBP-type peptidyl-prolyl cis-trans isomerase FklB